MAEYAVDIYYSGYTTVIVKAESHDEALEKAREQNLELDQSTLERWPDADNVHTAWNEN